VQGVGFRATTEQVARRFDVVGYVRNQADGTVELVAEGAEAEVERFLEALGERMKSFIEGVEQESSEPTGEFDRFRVRS
jgi:acylphosphatase